MTPRLLVTLGTGGVGKTTMAAALSVAATRRGVRTTVVSVDPARRLGAALEISLGDSPAPVRVEGRTLLAAMVESGPSFDALVARIVPDPAVQRTLLSSPVYRSFSRTLARSHAYAAIERIHAAVSAGGADLVVLDTPPGGAALELFDAPGALARFAEDRVVAALSGGAATPLLAGVRALFAAIAGREVAAQLGAFLGAFLPAREGFAVRAREVERLLSRTAHRVIVLSPTQGSVREAAALSVGLASRGLSPHGLIANRVPRRTTSAWDLATVATALDATGTERRLLDAAHAMGRLARDSDARAETRLARFVGETTIPVAARVADQQVEPAGVSALLALAPSLDGVLDATLDPRRGPTA